MFILRLAGVWWACILCLYCKGISLCWWLKFNYNFLSWRKKLTIIKIKQIFGPFKHGYCCIVQSFMSCECVFKANGSFKPFFLWTGAVGALESLSALYSQLLRREVHPKANAQPCSAVCRSHGWGSRSEWHRPESNWHRSRKRFDGFLGRPGPLFHHTHLHRYQLLF